MNETKMPTVVHDHFQHLSVSTQKKIGIQHLALSESHCTIACILLPLLLWPIHHHSIVLWITL